METLDDFTPDVVIIGGGDYPTHPRPLRLLREAPRVVCLDDAAYSYYEHEGRCPWRVVGDCDSLYQPTTPERAALLPRLAPLVRRFTGQDDNDQTKGVTYCLRHGLRRLALVGATGRREDHTLGNISLLTDYAALGLDVRLYTDYGMFMAAGPGITRLHVAIPKGYSEESDTCAERVKSTQLSLFNLTAQHLTGCHLRYPLSPFTRWWQGTLNEATDETVDITADGDYLLYIAYL